MAAEEQVELLRDIRDLLRVIAEANLQPYADSVVKRVGADVVQKVIDEVGASERQWDAVCLMDGSRSQSDIRASTGMDAGQLSRLVKKLVQADLVSDKGGMPACVYSSWELRAMRSTR